MSRIGKKSIQIPTSVSVTIEKEKVSVKGKHGLLEKSFLNYIKVDASQNEIVVLRNNDTKVARAYHGLTRALLQNMIIGVSEKFTKILTVEGVGYKFQMENKKLVLNMGFTHPVIIDVPDDISIKVESPTKILISGIDKEKVGLLAAQIRMIRPPEPYKGKGIRYEGEKIIRKAGKTGK